MTRAAGWLGLALALPLGGCAGLLDAANAATATVVWRKDGFFVEDKRREFRFDADANSETLEFDGQLVYVDLDRDGRVDTYEKKHGGKIHGTWSRNEPGTDDLFAEADRAFADARAMLDVDGLHEEWAAMSDAQRARGHGHGARER